jgi:recombination protein RecT
MTTAKNSLTKAKKELTAPRKTKTIFDVIKGMESQFSMALPKHLNSERFVRIAITEIRKNPKLAECSRESLLGALMQSAQLGLEPGTLGQAYLIPYGKEVQFQISYKGMIELLRRSGQLSDIYAYEVYANDEFEIEYGLDRKLIHKPNFSDRGEVIGFYAVAILKDGAKSFVFMTKNDVDEFSMKYSQAMKKGWSSPWKTDYSAMAKKTVIKQLLKYLPVSVEFLDNIHKEDIKTEYRNGKIEEVEEVDVFDPETGEIVEKTKASKTSKTKEIKEVEKESTDIVEEIFN